MRILLFSLSCLLFATPAAFAQSAPPPPDSTEAPSAGPAAPTRRHESIWTLDANHDGMISRDEAQTRRGLVRHFDQIDANHNGRLDRGEIRAWHQQTKARHAERTQQQSQPSEDSGEPTSPPPAPPSGESGGG